MQGNCRRAETFNYRKGRKKFRKEREGWREGGREIRIEKHPVKWHPVLRQIGKLRKNKGKTINRAKLLME